MGKRGAGPALEPDAPASIEIYKVTLPGHPTDLGSLLNDHMVEKIEEMVMEQENQRYDDYLSDRAEYLMERELDR